MEWYLKVIRNYAGFSGRARRKEYWMFALFNMIIIFGLNFLAGIVMSASEDGGMMATSFLGGLYGLAVFLPSLAVIVRRLHDTGKSGWYYLWIFVPLIGLILVFIALVKDSDPGENKYGPNPKMEGVSAV